MDGYAVRSTRLGMDGPIDLTVTQRIAAGYVGTAMEAESAARIFTGASIPEGAEAVIMQEACTLEDGIVRFDGPIKPGTNIRRRGEDMARGDIVLEKGVKLTPAHLALAASVGVGTLAVVRPLRVAILSTGDELCEPGTPLGDGQIYNSNRYSLTGLLQCMGCQLIDMGVVRDDADAVKQTLASAAGKADLVITTGGVSVGEEDHVKSAVRDLGALSLWRLNIKPGKPLAFGHVSGTAFVGLPGNPVSAYATFLLVAAPLIRHLQGRQDTRPKCLQAVAGFERDKPGKRREYIRVRAESDTQGRLVVQPYPQQGSAIMTGVCWADGLVQIPEKTLVTPGDSLFYYSFDALLA